MSTIIKTNSVAVNEDINFKYNSVYGGVEKESYDFFNLNTENNFTIPKINLLAIDAFIIKMKNEGIWNKLTELALLYGNSYNTVTKKLKATLGPKNQNMTSIASDNISRYELSGDVYIGRDNYTRLVTADPALNMGFTAFDLGAKWGFSFYTDISTVENTRSTLNTVMGSVFATKGLRVRLQKTDNVSTWIKGSFATNETGISVSSSAKGLIRVTAERLTSTAKIKVYLNDLLIYNGVGSVLDASADLNKDIWVFGENPYVAGATDYYGYSGKVRFIAFDDNTMTDREHKIFNDQIEILMAALGKVF